jgi:hypothetical protein
MVIMRRARLTGAFFTSRLLKPIKQRLIHFAQGYEIALISIRSVQTH